MHEKLDRNLPPLETNSAPMTPMSMKISRTTIHLPIVAYHYWCHNRKRTSTIARNNERISFLTMIQGEQISNVFATLGHAHAKWGRHTKPGCG